MHYVWATLLNSMDVQLNSIPMHMNQQHKTRVQMIDVGNVVFWCLWWWRCWWWNSHTCSTTKPTQISIVLLSTTTKQHLRASRFNPAWCVVLYITFYVICIVIRTKCHMPISMVAVRTCSPKQHLHRSSERVAILMIGRPRNSSFISAVLIIREFRFERCCVAAANAIARLSGHLLSVGLKGIWWRNKCKRLLNRPKLSVVIASSLWF